MKTVQGGTGNLLLQRVWLVAVLFLLASCQVLPPASLPKSAKIAVVTSKDSRSGLRLEGAIKTSLGKQGEYFRVRSSASGMNRMSKQLSRKSYAGIILLDPTLSSLAERIRTKKIYFGQSFDYGAADKLGDRFRGVSIVPDARSLFQVLRKINPEAKTIGIVAGKNLDPMIKKISADAKKYNFEVVFRSAVNDRAFLYQARKIAGRVDVYWLLPDSRVLSGDSIQEFMRWAIKQGKPVISFTPNLLKLGALMSIEPNDMAVANELRRLLAYDLSGSGRSGPAMKYVEKVDIRISRISLKRMGLSIPPELEKDLRD